MATKLKSKNEKQEQKDRLREFYLSTIESGSYTEGDIENLDYINLMCKSYAENKMYTMFSCSLFMFKYKYLDEDSILIIFSVPSPSNIEASDDGKHISQKIMEIVKVVEDCFVSVDYMHLKEVKEEKFSYFTVVKKIKEGD
jgi:hypothetical protein